MFIGQYALKLDRRYRFKLPAPFAESLKLEATEPRSMIFVQAEAIRVYSSRGFEDLVKVLSSQPDDAKARATLRIVMSRSERISFGLSRTVQMPWQFIEYYGLTGGHEIILLGCNDYFEIWDRELWKKREEGEDVELPELDGGG